MDNFDIEIEFRAHYGNVDLCGIELKAADVLKDYDVNLYDDTIDAFGEAKGYYKCPDRGDWFESYDAMKEYDAGYEE